MEDFETKAINPAEYHLRIWKRYIDNTCVVIYSGVAIMVMDRTEYSNKAQNLLEDGETFKEIKTEPTNKLKSKLINLFKKTTFFQFQSRFFEQLQGAAIRSPISSMRPTYMWKILRPEPLTQLNIIQGFGRDI